MSNRIFVIILVAVITIKLSLAESGQSTSLGNKMYDFRLSINLSNSIVKIGSKLCVHTSVQNLSTNVLWISPTSSRTFYLTNGLGKIYYLVPIDNSSPYGVFISNTRPTFEKLKPNEIKNWFTTLNIGRDIDVGNYSLLETHDIRTGQGEPRLVTSNALDVEIVK